jgi:TPR repeat protein
MKMRAMMIGAALCVALGAAAGAVKFAHAPSRDIDEWRVRALSAHDRASMTKLRLASWSGNDGAAFALGAVLVGRKDEARVREGIGWLERSARDGNDEAQLLLGRVLFTGATGVPHDYARSRAWLERAALRLPPAAAPLHDADHDTDDDEHDHAHAPSAGAQAAYWLSSIWRNGYGVTRDASEGERWLALAARHGVPQAQFQLANVYRDRGDDAQALAWLRLSAHAELPEANLALAIAYRNGEMGLHRSDDRYWNYVKETLHDYKHRVQ